MALEVSGPPNGTFIVSVNVQPFNTTSPVYENVSEMPASASLPNGSAVLQIFVPTGSLGVELVMVTLSNATSGVFGTFYVGVLDGSVTQRLNQQQNDLNENASRINALLGDRNLYRNWMVTAIAFTTVLDGFLLYVIFATRTAAREKRWVKKQSQAVGNFAKVKPSVDATPGHEIPTRTLTGNPSAVWVLRPPLCEVCRIPQYREVIADHGAAHGLTAGEVARRLSASDEGRRHARAVIAGETEAPRDAEKVSASRVDLTDILGKKGAS